MRRTLRAIGLAFSAAVTAGLLVEVVALAGRANPVLDFLLQFLGVLGWAGVAAAAILLAYRQIAQTLIVAAASALAIATVWPQPALEACTSAPKHRVVFFNLFWGLADQDANAAYLSRTGADILVLAETPRRLLPPLDRLKALYPYTLDCEGRPACDVAILSKTPFTDMTAQASRAGGPRSLLAIAADFPDGRLNLIGVHLLPLPWKVAPPNSHAAHADGLAEEFAGLPAPRFLVGDLNGVTWGRSVRMIAARANGRPLATWGTWPAWLPAFLRFPIDQVIAGPGIACAVKSIGPALTSDHRPIIVDFALGGSAN